TQSLAWLPPACSGASFVGCAQTGQPRCSDSGGPVYWNWDPSMWNVCQTACGLPNPDAYCAWTPARCSGGTFTGCERVGQPICSDWGAASFPNWNDAAWAACHTACTSSCPAANPNDNLTDDAALQACLNAGGTIRLVPGTPGYLIGTGLVISRNDTLLTSAAAPG